LTARGQRAPWLSVVIPTIARPTLRRTLQSLRAQPECEGVEVLVVADTFGGPPAGLAETRAYTQELGFTLLEHDGGLHCYGHPQRTHGARTAQAPYVWFSQDDNIAAPDSLASIEATIDRQSIPRPLFFRFRAFWGEIIWRAPFLDLGNIDADCLVFPRHIAQKVEWGLRYEGDYDAARRAYELVDGNVAWCDPIIAISRPRNGLMWWEQ
jgi:hypothetical protein